MSPGCTHPVAIWPAGVVTSHRAWRLPGVVGCAGYLSTAPGPCIRVCMRLSDVEFNTVDWLGLPLFPIIILPSISR